MALSQSKSAQAPTVRIACGATPGTAVPVPLLDWPNGQVLAIGSGSGISSTYVPSPAAGSFVNALPDTIWEICGTADAWYTIGTAPTAQAQAAGNSFLPASTLRYVYIPAGNFLAVTYNSSGTASGFLAMIPAVLGA